MAATFWKALKRTLALAVLALVALLAWRAYDALSSPELERWHTFVPQEATAEQIAKADWAQYLEAEIGPVKAGHDCFRLVQLQDTDNIGAHLRGGRCSKGRDCRAMRKPLQKFHDF